MTDFIKGDSRDQNNIKIVDYGTVKKILPNGVLEISLTSSVIIRCAPLLPRHLYVLPKLEQGVLVISANHKKTTSTEQLHKGYWVGPLISRLSKIDNEDSEASKALIDQLNDPNFNGFVENTKNSKGLYPNDGDISLLGRGSGDLILKEKETVIRISKFKDEKNLEFNNNSIGYLQLKDNEDNSSTINVVANKINLISHNGVRNYDLTNREELITEESQKEINETAQSIVYGENLVQFLSLVKQYVQSHVHPYHGMPSVYENSQIKLLGFKLESILNKNIKTN